MKKFFEYIGFVFFILFGFVVLIVSIPFIILSIPFTYQNRKKFKEEYFRFLIKNNGKNFFCYNNRKNSKDFIEIEIIPKLNSSIEIIYLNGKVVESGNYPKEYASYALRDLKYYSKFPHLMKIRDGEVIDKSINSIFYSIKNQNKCKEYLFNEINSFFEID